MYKLYVLDDKTKEEKVLKFETIELAILYRDYHITFGNWSSVTKWVSEDDIAKDEKAFAIDSKYTNVGDKLKLFYKVTTGLKLKIQKENVGSVEEYWMLFRRERGIKLAETDWSQLPDCELNVDERKEYRNYRSYLRTLPSLHNSDSILSAKVYSFEDWKKGKR